MQIFKSIISQLKKRRMSETKKPNAMSITITRGLETFTFENTENIPSDEFGVLCENSIDEQLAARARARKYSALGAALLKQAETKEFSSDYKDRKEEVAAYEKEFKRLSKNFIGQLNAIDGTNA